MNHRETAYGLLRATMGVIFLFYGIGKFIGGVGNFVGGMNQHFSGKLPAAMVMPFAYVLPFGEVTAGLLILLGLFTRKLQEFSRREAFLLLAARATHMHRIARRPHDLGGKRIGTRDGARDLLAIDLLDL